MKQLHVFYKLQGGVALFYIFTGTILALLQLNKGYSEALLYDSITLIPFLVFGASLLLLGLIGLGSFLSFKQNFISALGFGLYGFLNIPGIVKFLSQYAFLHKVLVVVSIQEFFQLADVVLAGLMLVLSAIIISKQLISDLSRQA